MPTQLESDVQTSEDAFRTEVRQFLSNHFPDELKGKGNLLSAVEGPTDESDAERKGRWKRFDHGNFGYLGWRLATL